MLSLRIAYLSAAIALISALIGTVLMTELGQILNLPSDWVYGFFRARHSWLLVALIALVVVIAVQVRHRFLGRSLFAVFVCAVLAGLFAANFFVPYFWLRSEQHTAEFISVAKADDLLGEQDDVLVLEINGDARAYPTRWMQLPHFAGHVVGGKEVVMSYCALSDLPQAFATDLDGQAADYRVIAQVHNNLIFTDTHSGELFQQITGRGGFSGQSPDRYPVQRMPWRSFKALYPAGQVFFTEPNLFDRGTQWVFDSGLQKHYQGEPLFPTLRMDDDRVPAGEPVWGINLDGEQLAITRAAFDRYRAHAATVGGNTVLLVWYPKYEMLGAYLSETLTPGPIAEEFLPDPYGKLGDEYLRRAPLYPGVRWMVWSHWYPDTALIDGSP